LYIRLYNILYGVEIYANRYTDTVGILSFVLITILLGPTITILQTTLLLLQYYYQIALFPNCTVSKLFVLYTNLFTKRINCQAFVI